MYYSGMPFIEENEIKFIELGDSYFEKKNITSNLFIAVYERIKDNVVFQVVYQEANINDNDLLNYHRETYGYLPFFIENNISEKVYRLTTFLGASIKGSRIMKYDNLWRDLIEEIYDENSLLVEYRRFIYDNNKRLPCREKIFFASSWHISEENYD